MSFETDSQDIVDTATTENTGEASQETQQPVDTGEQVQGDAKPQENKDGGNGNPDPKPKRNRAQERIEQTTRENAELRRKVAEYEAQQNAPKPVEKPKIEEFESYDEYEEKLEEWRIGEAMRRMEEKQGKSNQERSQADQQAKFQSAIDVVSEDIPDFDSIVEAGIARQLPIPITLDELAAEFGYDAETQVRLLYEIAKDEEFHKQISGSTKLKAARLLSERADSFLKPAAPKIPNAPKPITPTSANAPVKRDAETMSDNEFLKSRGL